MTTTPITGATEVPVGSRAKEQTINAGFRLLEGLAAKTVKDKDLTAPPGSPADGDLYIVATSPTGAWSGKAGQIALYAAGWVFLAPAEGWAVYVQDEDTTYTYSGSVWQSADANAATPALTFGGGSTGLTYSAREAYYSRVGKLVTLQARILLSAKGSSTGAAKISLPVAAKNVTAPCAVGPVWFDALDSGVTHMVARVDDNAATASLYKQGAGGLVAATHADFTDSSEIIVTLTYQAA